jgi:hypothetical protein
MLAPTASPRRFARHAITRVGRWTTWSVPARRFFARYAAHLRRRPAQHWVRGSAPYGFTYSLPLTSTPSRGFHDDLLDLARSLLALRVSSKIVLLRDLFSSEVDRTTLRTFLAWMRAALVEIEGDGSAALYTPPSPERAGKNDFLLHADLFAARRVMLVFDDVPADGSGRALLLPLARADRALASTSMPTRERRQAIGLVRGPWHRDGFDRLYSLLYGDKRSWRREVSDRLRREAIAVAFERGEGYLLEDRNWLHGRELVTGPVRTHRFHRLIHGHPFLRGPTRTTRA